MAIPGFTVASTEERARKFNGTEYEATAQAVVEVARAALAFNTAVDNAVKEAEKVAGDGRDVGAYTNTRGRYITGLSIGFSTRLRLFREF
jgi:hypothetical protein